MRYLIILFFVISAFWALLISGRRRARRAVYVWGIAALGAVAGLILNSAAEPRLPPQVTNTVVTQLNPPLEGTRVAEAPPPAKPEPIISRPTTPEPPPADRQLQPRVPVGARENEAPETSVPRRAHPTSTRPYVEHGGVSVAIRGNWSPLDQSEVESAVIGELRNAKWNGFTSGGEKVLIINGTLRDLDLTLGQIPTTTVSMHWSLRPTGGGAVIAQGGLSDVRGTGLEQSAAQIAAIQRAAHQLAQAIAGITP
jgi:hypothetical protein